MTDIKHCVYKYVYKGEIIYIGKTDSSLNQRVYAHSGEDKFSAYLSNTQVYYFKTVNPAESKLFETYLIDLYKPKLNVADKYKSTQSLMTMQEPEWTEYTGFKLKKTSPVEPKKHTKEDIQYDKGHLLELKGTTQLPHDFSGYERMIAGLNEYPLKLITLLRADVNIWDSIIINSESRKTIYRLMGGKQRVVPSKEYQNLDKALKELEKNGIIDYEKIGNDIRVQFTEEFLSLFNTVNDTFFQALKEMIFN